MSDSSLGDHGRGYIPKMFLAIFDEDKLQRFDFELPPYRSNESHGG